MHFDSSLPQLLKVYMGVLSQKCVLDYEGDVMNNTFYRARVNNESTWYLSPETGKHIMCGNSTGAGKCPEGTTCLQVGQEQILTKLFFLVNS